MKYALRRTLTGIYAVLYTALRERGQKGEQASGPPFF
jgi:hypothetical protein